MTAEPAHEPAQLPHGAYAGLVSRLGAILIDVLAISLLATATRRLPAALWESVLALPEPRWLAELATAAAAVVPWLYFTISWWLTNRTVGGLILGLCVLRDDGGELSLPHAAVRAVVGLALAPLWMIGLLSVLWDPRRRAWHDRLLRTVVRYSPTTRSPG